MTKLTNSEDESSSLLSNENTASLLRNLLLNNTTKNIQLGTLIKQFEGRSFGGILLILSILALLPIISFIAGIIILFIGCQMLFGFSVPLLPKLVMEQKVNRANLETYLEKSLPWLDKAHIYIRPRWLIFSHALSQRLLGILVILLALVSLLPLPLSNMPPSISLMVLALGILERDGLLISIALFLSSLALMLGYLILSFVMHSITLMI